MIVLTRFMFRALEQIFEHQGIALDILCEPVEHSPVEFELREVVTERPDVFIHHRRVRQTHDARVEASIFHERTMPGGRVAMRTNSNRAPGERQPARFR